MNFELLPDDIFLDLFDYLNDIDLLRAFYDLNSRFNVLLYNRYHQYRFKFNSISKSDFDTICQQHLPSLYDRIIELSLSDGDDTPGQMDLFFSYIPTLKQFTHLQKLSLTDIDSNEILLKIFDQCPNLTHLTLDLSYIQKQEMHFINQIWDLPKLIYIDLRTNIDGQPKLYPPTKCSSTLKSVNIYGKEFTLNEIDRLYTYTPSLKYLNIQMKSIGNATHSLHLIPSLFSLKIKVYGKSSDILTLLEKTPNLHVLHIELIPHLINGYQWEQLIRQFLPKLKQFHLKMSDPFFTHPNFDAEVNRLFDSFNNPFWIHEHQWFIRCLTWKTSIYLSTISNTYDCYEDIFPDTWKSTDPSDHPYTFYNTMTSICNEVFFDEMTNFSSNIQFHSIKLLAIKLPIHPQFWLIVSNFTSLEYLIVSAHQNQYQLQVQAILDQAKHLQTLNIRQDLSLPLQKSLFKYENLSVYRLHLQDHEYYWNENKCLELIHSPLGVQCQILFIKIKTLQCMLILIKNMLQLRTLIVQYHRQISNEDKLMQWLKDHLPSICMIVKRRNISNLIHIWIQ